MDNEIVMMNTLYKERFPKGEQRPFSRFAKTNKRNELFLIFSATMQMEERLKNFIGNNETLSTESDIAADSVAIVRFVHHQVI